MIDKIILHCSATREGQDIDIETIREWHIKDRGWRDVGYHYVVKLDGTVQAGRPVGKPGAHCKGENHNIGVCYIGGVDTDMQPKDTRTDEQKDALLGLFKEIKVKYPDIKVYGHRDFAKKACPSFDAKAEYEDL